MFCLINPVMNILSHCFWSYQCLNSRSTATNHFFYNQDDILYEKMIWRSLIFSVWHYLNLNIFCNKLIFCLLYGNDIVFVMANCQGYRTVREISCIKNFLTCIHANFKRNHAKLNMVKLMPVIRIKPGTWNFKFIQICMEFCNILYLDFSWLSDVHWKAFWSSGN